MPVCQICVTFPILGERELIYSVTNIKDRSKAFTCTKVLFLILRFNVTDRVWLVRVWRGKDARTFSRPTPSVKAKLPQPGDLKLTRTARREGEKQDQKCRQGQSLKDDQ